MIDQFCSIFEKKLSEIPIIAEAFFRALEDVPMEFITPAALEVLKTAKWMPRPADVREPAVIAWRRWLRDEDIRNNLRLTHKEARRYTREELRQDMKEFLPNIKALDPIGDTKWERERERIREDNKRREAERNV
jgi:hypothetical protein